MSGSISGSAIATGLAAAVGGAVLSQVMAPKIDKPAAPAPVPTITDAEADKDALAAQKKQQKAAAAAVGRADTILTDSQLGSASATGNAAVKTLIGM